MKPDTENNPEAIDFTEVVRQDYLKALQRLIEGTPLAKQNVAKASIGKLKVTISAVAVEAGRSRSLISREGGKYSDVREHILNYMAGKSHAGKNRKFEIDTLKSQVSKLKVELKLALEAQAVLVIERMRAEREADKWRRAYRGLKESSSVSFNLHAAKASKTDD
ncbi:hypothetical protein O999_04915 [Pseudomonas putida LF54]|uniref:hypothetical protein n=1 Tax=Pseudomonas putida TaxID=303 RepID=UPI0003AEE934|nr:hypothetical protein [Pseudomonas putida]ERL03067.1 hypothetical protein O999_04915 [Pseudomonas putida LF54]